MKWSRALLAAGLCLLVPVVMHQAGCAAGTDDDIPTGPVTSTDATSVSSGSPTSSASTTGSGQGGIGGSPSGTTSSGSSSSSDSTSSGGGSGGQAATTASASSASSGSSSSSASSSTGSGATCGDGIIEGNEACDDGNQNACGTCSANCTQTQAGKDCPQGITCKGDGDCICKCNGGTCSGPYGHSINIDGTNDFATDETFQTTSSGNGYTAYSAWDGSYLYLGMKGDDVAAKISTKSIIVYLSGSAGTNGGITYNTQTPSLPSGVKWQWHVRWQSDNTTTVSRKWNGSAWVDAGWNFTNNVFENGNYFEMRIPRSDFGSPDTVAVVMAMINTEDTHEATYAGLPSDIFSDGVNPAFTHYLDFNFAGCTPPTTYSPL